MTMGLLYLQSLPGPKIYRCKCCNVHTASNDDMESKNFTGRYGPAYLFQNVVNVLLGPDEDRLLSTGLHVVRDIYCSSCNYVLGWKYMVMAAQRAPHQYNIAMGDNLGRSFRFCYMYTNCSGSCILQDKAHEDSQKYKEGKYILERARLVKNW